MVRIWNDYVPLNTLLVAGLEWLLLSVLIGLALFGSAEYTDSVRYPGNSILLISCLLSAAIVFGMTAFGLYAQPGAEGWQGMIVRLPAAMFVGAALFVGFQILYMEPPRVNLEVLTAATLGGFVIIVAERAVVLRFRKMPWLRPRVLVVGSGSRAGVIEQLTRRDSRLMTFDLVGFVPVKETAHAVPKRFLLPCPENENLCDLARRQQVTDIVVGVRERRGGGMPTQALLDCKLAGIRITDLSSFFERQIGQIRLDSLNASWLVFGTGFRQSRVRAFTKRALDIVSSLVLLLIAGPIMLLVALAILATMGTPVLYRQQRVGQNGKLYWILKFRSMRADAESDGKARWASSDDDRITHLGRFLRKLRLDELPQVFNVLRGEMSFVGPRPERPEFVAALREQIPFYDTRHSIKPGITGWAQVRYPYGASIEDAREKLQFDLYYVKNHSLALDCLILLDTIQVVLFGKGAR
ncbi:TIGR03013 family PEP-CTERM/XrtA system glycosyltransferase [Methylonatrum kenyense]|uniref:TIGR03013 family XrtA/PEP-CTERM system glycosyltransferase n=1 Tax=Methylonatrum kenyense TaxID=455253 RepID=UPI0020C08635|nr:TIGR03013 family XrtA/PEP-CTERM system glycosyltransferase [Methylonatrum kenyense]MCK8517163.1 TIGR03013 family PEP-CTERM/XrtA system glycosyltransferase [Methylonatrum kenyense]